MQIGNAKIQGMTEDLNMTGNDYNIALLSFFITYIIFEVPSNLVSPQNFAWVLNAGVEPRN